MEISRERRSTTKLSDWTGPTEGTEEDEKKKKRRRRWTDGWMIDGWIVDEAMGERASTYLVLRCAFRKMHAYRGGVCSFCLR